MSTGMPRRQRGLANAARRQVPRAPLRPLGLTRDEAIEVRDEMWNIDMRLRELVRKLDDRRGQVDVDGVLAQVAKARVALNYADVALLMRERVQ